MTATNEQIVAEANRRALERGWGAPPVEHYIIEVVREGWTPPVDRDLLVVREIVATEWNKRSLPVLAGLVQSGHDDKTSHLAVALAAYKAGREAEAERAKVLLAALDDMQKNSMTVWSARASAALAAHKAGKEAAR